MEKDPRDRQADPDDKSKEGNKVNHSQTTDSLLPELPEVGDQPDGKKGEGKESGPKDIRFAAGGSGRFYDSRRVEADPEHD